MKTLLTLLMLFLAPMAGARESAVATASETTQAERFTEAAQAYDEGRLDEAIAQYEGILTDGYASAALYYNLGNSYFRISRPGMAVYRYRQGWHLAPRDTALLANLNYALQFSNALGPEALLVERLLLKLSREEWIKAGAGASMAAALMVLLLIVDPRRRMLYRRILSVCAVMVALALAGLGAWGLRWNTPEVVIVEKNIRALFAPLESAPPHFDVPEGTIARQTGRNGGWLEIRVGGKTGWIPEASGHSVYPCREG